MTYSAEHHEDPAAPAEQAGEPQLLVSPGIVSVFGLASALRPTDGFPETYVAQAVALNTPPLEAAVTGRAQSTAALDFTAQQRIEARARTIVTAPYESEPITALDELARISAWFEGSIAGKSDDVIATEMEISRRTLNRLSARVRQHLGVTNQASAVYSILLHGHEYGKRRLGAQVPVMTPNRLLHLYLGALGIEDQEALELTHVGPNVSLAQVKRLRRQTIHQLGAKALPKAILKAYQVGLFRQLD